jgi:hypothetical protein
MVVRLYKRQRKYNVTNPQTEAYIKGGMLPLCRMAQLLDRAVNYM